MYLVTNESITSPIYVPCLSFSFNLDIDNIKLIIMVIIIITLMILIPYESNINSRIGKIRYGHIVLSDLSVVEPYLHN